MSTSKTNPIPLSTSIPDPLEREFDLDSDGGANAGALNDHVKHVGHDVLARIVEFWTWFVEHESRLREIKLDSSGAVSEANMGRIIELGEACTKIDDDLSLEIEEESDSPFRKLVISANGISDVFPVVEAVVDSSPALPHWLVVKYRQRQKVFHPLSLKGRTVKPEQVRFGVAHNKSTGEFGIYIFMPGYSPTEREIWQHIGFIFLDLALGEFDVATKVRCVEFEDERALPGVQRVTIEELPRVFDHLFSKSRH